MDRGQEIAATAGAIEALRLDWGEAADYLTSPARTPGRAVP